VGLPIIEDEHPFEGPLQALKGIWEKTSNSRILLVACDMPLMEPDVIQALWTADSHSDIVILEGEGRYSPLPGVYCRTTHPSVKSLLEKGRKDLKALWKENLTISIVSRQRLHQLDPLGKSLWNINTPQDLSFLVE
jgi:molybdopterin-guanine dinucleotide biosynthesis protein A